MITIKICAALVVDPQARMLLVRKRNTSAFMQPGGKPESGESPRQTIARELQEELGIVVDDARYCDLGTFTALAANEPGHQVAGHAFLLELTQAEAAAVAVAAEIDEAQWVSVSEASALPLAPLTRDYFIPLVDAASAGTDGPDSQPRSATTTATSATVLTKTSKFLSFVLRHQPEAIGLQLDSEGWAEIDSLITAAATSGQRLSPSLIAEVVATSDKKRFAISADGTRIRAVQGHSTPGVAIDFVDQVPPEVLFHGTATHFLQAILREGLSPQQRQYVHLSPEIGTAVAVGQRYGAPVVLRVAAGRMHRDGHRFFQADNGVWLTPAVPVDYLTVDDSR